MMISTVPALSPMHNQIRDYAWGSTSALAQMQCRTPGGGPEAELWMGAHPAAPSELVLDNDEAMSLADVVARFPESVLGADSVARFGPRLPFALKVLAIARPEELTPAKSIDDIPAFERAMQSVVAEDAQAASPN